MPTTSFDRDPRLLDDARGLTRALGDLIRIVQFRDRDRACCYDVSVSQCYALKAIAERGPITVNQLAADLYLDKSTASRLANGLEEKGYVARDRDAADGRITLLAATPEGAGLHARIEEDLAREYAELIGDFEPEVRAAITRLLGRLATSFAARVDASGGSCSVV
jgi:DNA-binding MarR family transcriptional regulator